MRQTLWEFDLPANEERVDHNIVIEFGDSFTVTASGEWTYVPNVPGGTTGPDGGPLPVNNFYCVSYAKGGCLVGAFNAGGWFPIGSHFSSSQLAPGMLPNQPGEQFKLYLNCNDVPAIVSDSGGPGFADNSGSIHVKVELHPAGG